MARKAKERGPHQDRTFDGICKNQSKKWRCLDDGFKGEKTLDQYQVSLF